MSRRPAIMYLTQCSPSLITNNCFKKPQIFPDLIVMNSAFFESFDGILYRFYIDGRLAGNFSNENNIFFHPSRIFDSWTVIIFFDFLFFSVAELMDY